MPDKPEVPDQIYIDRYDRLVISAGYWQIRHLKYRLVPDTAGYWQKEPDPAYYVPGKCRTAGDIHEAFLKTVAKSWANRFVAAYQIHTHQTLDARDRMIQRNNIIN